MLGVPASKLVDAADAHSLDEALAEVRSTGIPGYLETGITTKAGRETIVSWCLRSLVSDAGELTHIVMTGVDVTEQRRAEDALAERDAELELITSTLPIGYYAAAWDPAQNQFNIQASNTRFSDITGFTPSVEDPFALTRLVHPDDLDAARDALAETANGEETERNLRIVRPDGIVRWVRSRVAPISADHGPVVGCVGWLFDITDEIHARAEVQRLNQITEESADLVLILTPAGGVRYANAAARQAVDGRTLDHLRDLLDEESAARFFDEVLPALSAREHWRGEMVIVTGDDQKIPVSQVFIAHGRTGDHPQPDHISMIARDISEHKALEQHLTNLAFHDPLTGLPNRALVIDRLEHALDRATRSQDFVAAMFLDLDYFKSINDELGHDAGDELLRMSAGRLEAALRPSDTVSRLGGDEFVVICEGVHDQREALKVAERVRTTIAKPFTINGRSVKTSASIGVALAKDNSVEPKDLIAAADTAAYRAKERGRNRYEVYTDDG
jgi:diguanylate cyclase (GGDEF)-like protein/PAS domain S-box-containing protein